MSPLIKKASVLAVALALGVLVSGCSSSSDNGNGVDNGTDIGSDNGTDTGNGNGADAGNDVTPPDADVQTGVFIDNAVGGIGYRTDPGGYEGVTNSDGEYQYEEGDTVVFFIGELELPPVLARGIVTPLNIAGTDDINNQIVVNIARLLQSLDEDGIPSNGITIPDGAIDVAAKVDFNVPAEEFAANPVVINLVANSGSTSVALISEMDAISHLQGSVDEQQGSLIGGWYYRDDSNPDFRRQYHIVLTIVDDKIFVVANDESELDDDFGKDGLEKGTYTWNLRTGVTEFEIATDPNGVVIDTNGEWGFSHPCHENEVVTMEVRGNELLLGVEGGVGETCDEAGDEATRIAFERVESETDPMIGSWVYSGEAENDWEMTVLTFMEGNGYMVAAIQENDGFGWTGIERGTYEIIDPATGHILFTTITNTNGQFGLSNSCAVLDVSGINDLACGPDGRDIVETITVDGDVLTFISEADTIVNDGEEDPVTLHRVRVK